MEVAPPQTYEFLKRVLEVYGENDEHDQLFWRVIDGRVQLFAMCNDLFWWATADAEEITPSNVDVLGSTARELAVLHQLEYLSWLFAARSRQMRPQRPCYNTMPPDIAALFDACGPERDPATVG